MFEPGRSPRVYATEPGVDLPLALISGLSERLAGQSPVVWAKTDIYVNTRRMQRRILDLFAQGPARLLPRIRTIADLGQVFPVAGIPSATLPLRRRLELIQLIDQLLKQEPDLAPRSSLYTLADSLAELMDEMQGEKVSPAVLKQLDVGNLSGHWDRSLKFLNIVDRYFGAAALKEPDVEARQRLVVENLVNAWNENPPQNPIIVAGSTGSRGTTALFMRAVSRLPQGALILPGFDTDMPAEVWENLTDALTGEDHPQFRFARLLSDLRLSRKDVLLWSRQHRPPNLARNRVTSLALRPAPVTDQWFQEGGSISAEEIENATSNIVLIEAPSPKDEAAAIAVRMRKAVEDGQKVALITPDRTLTRRVTAALDRWNIEPDDSAGRPLALSAPGRFLRHVSDLLGQRLTSTALLTLLKHPLCNSGNERGDHLRWTRDLELQVLRRGLPFPTGQDLRDWVETKHADDQARKVWAEWLASALNGLEGMAPAPLLNLFTRHMRLAERLAGGPNPSDDAPSGELWNMPAGGEAKKVTDELEREASAAGILGPADYRDIFTSVLQNAEVRDPDAPHPNVMIWGTMEARVQGADLVILASLNDGVWPKLPTPDPWLNRQMRHDAGLLLPERRIGLAAHDFQMALAAKQVVLSRSVRDTESETVPSRWLNRIVNLLTGLPKGGEHIIDAMRERGQAYLTLASQLFERSDGPLIPAHRPSPRPPVNARPSRLSVTRVSRLVQDPYAIYAEQILRLRALDPLHRSPDAPIRGIVLHQIVETFLNTPLPETVEEARSRLMDITDSTLLDSVPWPAARILWRAKLNNVANQFIKDEYKRQAEGQNLKNEAKGRFLLSDLGFTLTGTADRIDRLRDGSLAIYDYKSGKIPAPVDQTLYDKQLLLEALIAKHGGFDGLSASPVSRIAYIALGSQQPFKPMTIGTDDIETIHAELVSLIARYQTKDQGYTALRLDPKNRHPGAYQHLARFGEWDLNQLPVSEEVGHEA